MHRAVLLLLLVLASCVLRADGGLASSQGRSKHDKFPANDKVGSTDKLGSADSYDKPKHKVADVPATPSSASSSHPSSNEVLLVRGTDGHVIDMVDTSATKNPYSGEGEGSSPLYDRVCDMTDTVPSHPPPSLPSRRSLNNDCPRFR